MVRLDTNKRRRRIHSALPTGMQRGIFGEHEQACHQSHSDVVGDIKIVLLLDLGCWNYPLLDLSLLLSSYLWLDTANSPVPT